MQSQEAIVLGESFVHIRGFGAVKAETLDILKEYKEANEPSRTSYKHTQSDSRH